MWGLLEGLYSTSSAFEALGATKWYPRHQVQPYPVVTPLETYSVIEELFLVTRILPLIFGMFSKSRALCVSRAAINAGTTGSEFTGGPAAGASGALGDGKVDDLDVERLWEELFGAFGRVARGPRCGGLLLVVDIGEAPLEIGSKTGSLKRAFVCACSCNGEEGLSAEPAGYLARMADRRSFQSDWVSSSKQIGRAHV